MSTVTSSGGHSGGHQTATVVAIGSGSKLMVGLGIDFSAASLTFVYDRISQQGSLRLSGRQAVG